MAPPEFQHLSCRADEGVLVITLTESRLQGDDLSDAVRQELYAAVDHCHIDRVILDFQHVKYLGSAGFRPLLSLLRKLRETGGAMIFCNLSPDVLDVFYATRLITSSRATLAPFEHALDLDDALQRLRR